MSVPQLATVEMAPGPMDHPVLVLGPSLGTSVSTLWGATAQRLGEHFRVLGWDLPGHGNSAPASDFTMTDALRLADRYRVAAITQRRIPHAEYWRVVQPMLASPRLRVEEVGRSLLGREIRSITFGNGPTTVLLWSQMHGDEATATMALAGGATPVCVVSSGAIALGTKKLGYRARPKAYRL